MWIYLTLYVISVILIYGMVFARTANRWKSYHSYDIGDRKQFQGEILLFSIFLGIFIFTVPIVYLLTGFAYYGMKFTLKPKEKKNAVQDSRD